MQAEQLKAELKAQARALGLDLVGVAPAEPFLAEKALLEERVATGLGPNPFECQEIAPRVYPEHLLPGVKSIIAAGISYLMPDEAPPPEHADGVPRGWLSRYCRGQDYHRLLHERLEALAAWLTAAVPSARTLVHVDTGPPLDRAVAERAGIGKFGKHTNLITRGFGTWVFLGEILTDVELPPDTPVTAACGSCTRCLDACPTGCLTPWRIEANRCLSYITQMKGDIPPEYREVMGNRLFGCDDCQDVCPYNKKAVSGAHPEFAADPAIGTEPDLLQLLAMTKGDFKRWFAPTAAGWRGKTTLQRNALIALANSGDPHGFETLAAYLGSESPLLRGHAAWGLGRLARLAPGVLCPARDALQRHLPAESDPHVRLEIETALDSLAQI